MYDTLNEKPRWMRELTRFLPLKSQFVLTGNIRDLVAYEVAPGQTAPLPLATALATELVAHDYVHVVTYDPAGGFAVADPLTGPTGDDNATLASIGLAPTDGRAAAGPDLVTTTLAEFAERDGPPIAMVIDYASRLIVRN